MKTYEIFKKNLKFKLKEMNMNFSDFDRLLGKTNMGYTARLLADKSTSIPGNNVFDKINSSFSVPKHTFLTIDISLLAEDELSAYIYLDELELMTKDSEYESPYYCKIDGNKWKTKKEMIDETYNEVLNSPMVKDLKVEKKTEAKIEELIDDAVKQRTDWLVGVSKGFFMTHDFEEDDTVYQYYDGIDENEPAISLKFFDDKTVTLSKRNSDYLGTFDDAYFVANSFTIYSSKVNNSELIEKKFKSLLNSINNQIRSNKPQCSCKDVWSGESDNKENKKEKFPFPYEDYENEEEILADLQEDKKREEYVREDQQNILKGSFSFMRTDDEDRSFLTKGFFGDYLREKGYDLTSEDALERYCVSHRGNWGSGNVVLKECVTFVNALNAPDNVCFAICDKINSGSFSIAWFEAIKTVPFGKFSETKNSVKESASIIDKSHYGLKDVKQKVIEYICVMENTKKTSGTIMCFDGPPGTGKTSIAESIAAALNRKFVKISGPSLDEGISVTGDRESYKSATYGQIAGALIQAGCMNPVILIDEIDKVTMGGYRTPVPALHEVLDPDHNATFKDVFLDAPLDLSNVIFILTSNDWTAVPSSLLDRMERVDFVGYTVDEKVHIAKEHLIDKVKRETGFENFVFSLSDAVIKEIIESYAPEPGTREMKRQIKKIAERHISNCLTTDGELRDLVITDPAELKNYIGRPIYSKGTTYKADKEGTALGLGVSTLGGSVLRSEIVKMPGSGKLDCTGSMQNVITESALVAFDYMKSYLSTTVDMKDYTDFFKKSDFHLNMPSGAVPKEGPSAGITFCIAIYSLFIKKAMKPHFAMTGEVNLCGEVTKIGGVKAKILGAYTNGITDVILPEDNREDCEELSDELKEHVKVHFVKTVHEAISIAFD